MIGNMLMDSLTKANQPYQPYQLQGKPWSRLLVWPMSAVFNALAPAQTSLRMRHAAAAAAAGKIISAVCHGPAGLVLAKGSDGSPLIKGKKMTGFTNSEEEAVGKTKVGWTTDHPGTAFLERASATQLETKLLSSTLMLES
jgi:hypothetical protein